MVKVSAVTFLSRVVSHFMMLASALRRMYMGADAPKVVSAKHASVDSSSFDLLSSEFGNVQAGSETHVAGASPGLGSQLTWPWSESFLVVQLATVMKVMTERGKAGEARGPARRNDVSSRGGRLPVRPRGKRSTSRHPVSSSGALTGDSDVDYHVTSTGLVTL